MDEQGTLSRPTMDLMLDNFNTLNRASLGRDICAYCKSGTAAGRQNRKQRHTVGIPVQHFNKRIASLPVISIPVNYAMRCIGPGDRLHRPPGGA